MPPHRDPETGQFVAGSSHDFADIEVVSFTANVGVQAADMAGGTGFTGGDIHEVSGVEVIDYDEIVDRNEELHLLEATHSLSVHQNSTASEDGNVAGAFEVSADPAVSPVTRRAPLPSTTAQDPDGEPVVGLAANDDSIDLIGKPLMAAAHGPFSDVTNGVGGGGSEGHDDVQTRTFPEEMARFHPRDEAFVNGRFVAWNIDDAGIHASVTGQHVYGVIAE